MSRLHRDPRSSGNALPILGLIVGLIMLALNLIMQAEAAELEVYTSHSWQEEYAARKPGMTYWPDGIVLEYPTDMKPMAELMAWKWSQRIGKTIAVRPATSDGRSTSGVITIVWRTPLEIFQLTGNVLSKAATQRWSWSDTGYIAGAIIYLPIGGSCMEHTLLHEIGHAIGIHSHDGAGPDDVMNVSQTHCTPALTAQDASMAPYEHDSCHAELLADGKLFMPVATAQDGKTYSVLLKPDNGRLVTVRLREIQPEKCAAVRQQGASVFLSDVRSPSGRYMGEIVQDGDAWRVAWASSR